MEELFKRGDRAIVQLVEHWLAQGDLAAEYDFSCSVMSSEWPWDHKLVQKEENEISKKGRSIILLTYISSIYGNYCV